MLSEQSFTARMPLLMDLQDPISFQLQDGFAPNSLDPAGAEHPGPWYRLALHTLAMHSTMPHHFSKPSSSTCASSTQQYIQPCFCTQLTECASFTIVLQTRNSLLWNLQNVTDTPLVLNVPWKHTLLKSDISPYLTLPYLRGGWVLAAQRWGHNRIGAMHIPKITVRLLEPLRGSGEPH